MTAQGPSCYLRYALPKNHLPDGGINLLEEHLRSWCAERNNQVGAVSFNASKTIFLERVVILSIHSWVVALSNGGSGLINI